MVPSRTLRLFARLLLGCALGLGIGGAQSAASATPTPVRFGIGDQHTAMFADERWQGLGLRLTRYNVPWDAVDDPVALAKAVAFADEARRAGVDVLMHLTGRAPGGLVEPAPTPAQYGVAMRSLVAVLRPRGVRTWGAWNEANHSTQPTIRRPDLAARYFLQLRAACPGCTVVALDLLTQGSPTSKGRASYRGYTQAFFKALGPKRSLVRTVGIHNYGELVETKGAYRSRDFMREVRRSSPKARFWLTESGGLAASRTRPCSEARQVIGTGRMFSHARSLARGGLDRLYMYNWTADTCGALFDSGLIRRDGTARPALAAIQTGAESFAR